MLYQKRRHSARLIVHLADVISSILGLRRLEFTHVQKEQLQALLVVNQLCKKNDRAELTKVRNSVSASHFVRYETCVRYAQGILNHFNELSYTFSSNIADEIELHKAYFLAFPSAEDFDAGEDEEIRNKIQAFHDNKSQILHLESVLVSFTSELEVFKVEYEDYLKLVADAKANAR